MSHGRATLAAVAPFLVIAGIVAVVYVYPHRPSDQDQIEAYCAYGAKSAAQWRGCVDHVTIESVRARHTPAAEFAHGHGRCPRHTYCASWQEIWAYCGEVEPVRQSRCRAVYARQSRVTKRRYVTSNAYDTP